MARHLITSALPYVNGVKHLGNLVGSLLPADVLARFLRLEGHEVLFVCGTDDHGAAPEIAAQRAGVPVDAWCDRLHAVQREQYRQLGLSFDHFGRTSSPTNHRLTRALYDRLRQAGLIATRTARLPYSEQDGRFLSDRFVLGTCPGCGFDPARGDECPGCGALLDPEELLHPRSALTGATDLRWRESEHRFLRLSALQDRVEAWVDAVSGRWPAASIAVARAWLASGLEDRCISRDLSWGVPVPDLPGKVFYCWFDAPIGYLALTAEADPDWQRWWSEESTVTQLLGKDNLPFHTLLFPAVQLGAGLRPADRIVGLHWLSWYGQRFSTSEGRGVFLDQALDLLPADVWRWGLLARAPEKADVEFTWEDLAAVVDKDLAGGFGNLVHRILQLAKRLDPAILPTGSGPDADLLRARSAEAVADLRDALAVPRFRAAIEALRSLFRAGNLHLEATRPWQLPPREAADAVATLLAWLRLVAVAVEPVVPFGSRRVLDALHVPNEERRRGLDWLLTLQPAPGRCFEVLPPLYDRIGRPG